MKNISVSTIYFLFLVFFSSNLVTAHGDLHEDSFSFTSLPSSQESLVPLVLRVTSYNPTTREYTFNCTFPSNQSSMIYWTVRPDTPEIETSFYTVIPTMSYNLTKNVMYHVGCQISNGTGVFRGDFHIDRRLGPNTLFPEVKAIETNGTKLVAQCSVPLATTHYNLYWTALSTEGIQPYPSFNNQNILNVTLPRAGLWDIDCGVWDIDKNTWVQWGFPLEFFNNGPAYIPNQDGCLPWQNCLAQNSTNTTTNTTYNGPIAPTWIEPTPNKTDVDLYSFKLHVLNSVDAMNYSLISTDFEIYDAKTSELIWAAYNQTQNTNRIEAGDGEFLGNLSGTDSLLLNRTYNTRVRFKFTGPIMYSPWSEWRTFETLKSYPVGNDSTPWIVREGYSIELVADNVNLPAAIVAAPNIYQNLPLGSRPKLYFTQLYGQVGVLLNNGTYVQYANNLLNFDSFGSIPGSGEIGLTGIYVDNTTGDLFMSIVYNDPVSGFMSKVVRFYTNDNGTGYTGNITLLSGLPAAPAHYAHTITRGPDGKLYLQIGDDDHSERSKDLNYLSGKILRFNEDGSIPSDNPIPGSYIYASGFRNPFGGVWRPGTNELYVTHNGPDENDGIFKVLRGSVFGWCCTTAENAWHLWPATVAPTQITIDSGNSNFPDSSNGTLYVALSGKTYGLGPSLNAKRISQFRILPDGTRESLGDLVKYGGTGRGTTLGVTFASDGLYFTDLYGEAGFVGIGKTKGRIYKITQGNSSNITSNNTFDVGIGQAPWFPQGLNIVWECKAIHGSGSYSYDYFLGDGDVQINSSSNSVYHTYPHNGTYTASCTARDLVTGLEDTATTTIVFGNTAQNQSNQNNQTNNSSNNSSNSSISVCYNSLSSIPSSCIGGNIILDEKGSCRTISCSNTSSSSNLTVLACEKPDNSAPQYFEMYKGTQNGAGITKICIGDVCISDNGFVKSSNYPICVNQVQNNTSSTNQTTNQTNSSSSSLNLVVAPWYPKGRDYIFICNATGFNPSSYDFLFGDGNKLLDYNQNNVYHSYLFAGQYNVSCTAKGQTTLSSYVYINSQ